MFAFCSITLGFAQSAFETIAKSMKFRSIGPALTSGRVADIAIHPTDFDTWYIAAASGGVWKTTDHGVTFNPIFDGESSYSIACVKIAPSNPNTIWVGTGENNNQRSVGYGDGVYVSHNAGKSWKNVGLKSSEHIGNIVVHPKNPNHVVVAAYGPLWSEGGERGIYITKDGGETWDQTLFIDKYTGISELIQDPSNPEILYASAHQRMRKVYTYVGGGPSSSIYKSVDGGKSWKKIENGLPKGQMGRIGLAIPKTQPNTVYAIVEAEDDKQGFYVSINGGMNWKKQSKFVTSGNYYQEIFCDPKNPNKIFAMNTWLKHSEDGGKTWQNTGESNKHVDNHSIWINPNNTDHFIVGCDGGIYETFNHAKTWDYKANLPITQFYKLALDNDKPFYNVYGGTQDNNTIGGPTRVRNNAGILNSDWFITVGGDGFDPAVDPTNPNIVYSQWQYGGLIRYDRLTGEQVDIKPMPLNNQEANRFNWDSPILISPHNPKHIYFASQFVHKSENRGDSWKRVSPDLTSGIDRNILPIMGRLQSVDAVMKNKSTTIYGNLTALDESPITQGYLIAGSDDGLIHLSTDGGSNWKQLGEIKGVPSQTYVNQLRWSKHDEKTIYAIFNNHKNGDFRPYIFKSSNLGKSWTSIKGNLPERGSTYCMEEDPELPGIIFVGTEFGVFATKDGGENYTQMKSGLPTVAVRELEIQPEHNDLVLATFGRGFYVCDDYSALRQNPTSTQILASNDGLLYSETNPMGGRGNASQGHALYAASTVKPGKYFYLYSSDTYTDPKKARRKKEKELVKEGKDTPYPSIEEIRAERKAEKPMFILQISDSEGTPIRRIEAAVSKGLHTIYWNGRIADAFPTVLKKSKPGRYSRANEGPLVIEGTYSAQLYKYENGNISSIGNAVEFEMNYLDNRSIPVKDKSAIMAFREDLNEQIRQFAGLNAQFSELQEQIPFIKRAIMESPTTDLELLASVNALEETVSDLKIDLYGDRLLSSLEVETVPGLINRLWSVYYGNMGHTNAPTLDSKQNLELLKVTYSGLKKRVEMIKSEIHTLESELKESGAAYTKGRNNWIID